MKAEDVEYLHDAMRVLDAHITQCMRTQRKIMYYLKDQNGQTKSDLDFEIKTFKGMHQPPDPARR